MAHEGFGFPAADAEGTTTAQPERDLQPGDPSLFGAAAKEEKKGIKGRVKGLLGRHGRRRDAQSPAGYTGKVRDKVAHKLGHDEENGPARLLSSSSSMSSSDEEDIGTVGFALDPTGPAVAGHNLGRTDFSSAPAGPGADFSDLDLKPNANADTERHGQRAHEYAKFSDPVTNPNAGDQHIANGSDGGVDHSEAGNSNLNSSEDDGYGGDDDSEAGMKSSEDVVGGSHSSERGISNRTATDDGEPHATNPTEAGNSNLKSNEDVVGGPHSSERGISNQTASDDGEPHATNPTGVTNSEGGAVLGDHEGPRDDNVKQEGFMSKIMDTFRSPKGEPAAPATD